MADESEQKTLQDLFRVMNDMRGEVRDLRGEVNTRFEDLRSEMNTRFDKQDDEIAAIRKVLDEDTATSKEVAAMGDKIAMVQADLTTVKDLARETAGQQRRLQSRLDRAHLPAE